MTPDEAAVGLERRLRRERDARLEAEAIAERTTRELYEVIQTLRHSQAELDDASALVGLLQRAATAANEASELAPAAQAVLDEVCRYTRWPVGHLYTVAESGELIPSSVWHLEDPEQYRAFREVTEATPLAVGVGLPGRVLATGAPAWIIDVTKDENFPRARHATDIGVKAAFGFPVLSGDETVAVLEFFAREPLEPDRALLATMVHVGTQLGRVVERTRAEQALRDSEEQTRVVIDTAHDAFVAVNEESRIVDWNRQAECIFGWTAEEAIGLRLVETIIPPQHRDAHLNGLARFVAGGEGPVLGRRLEISALHRDGHEFAVELTPWVVRRGTETRFNAFVHDISERKAFEQRLEHQALHDPLTALPNRTLLLDRLRQALSRAQRAGSITAVLFLDLDRFKAVNDTMGHESGDQLLLAVAQRLPRVLREGDTLARLGGDEFVVVCEDLADAREATRVAERVLGSLGAPFTLASGEVYISASVGVALARGMKHDVEPDADQLLGDADMAMYRAKERGRNIYDVYDETMRARLTERVTFETALRRAIDDGQLAVVYQPTIDLFESSVAGAEALVRWQHPERGLIGPAEFIPLAEETGLILPLGEVVLRDACCQVADWKQRGVCRPDFSISVNVSVRQLESGAFVSRVHSILSESGLAPESLVLEVTESALMEDITTVIRRLWELRELGVRLAIDDFGTGYSSLDRLRRLPVETLKIDMSFIAELDTAVGAMPLVTAMIAMAHSLGIAVIAEGVETPGQLRTLLRLSCDAAQGFLLGRPVSAVEFEALLRDPTPLAVPSLPRDETVDPLGQLEATLTTIVAEAIAGKRDLEHTTQSLLAELERLAGLRKLKSRSA